MTEENPIVYVIDDDPSVQKALERLLRSARSRGGDKSDERRAQPPRGTEGLTQDKGLV